MPNQHYYIKRQPRKLCEMNMKIIQSVHEKQKFKSLSMHTISKRNKQLIINNLLLNLFNSSILVIVEQFIEQQQQQQQLCKFIF